MRLFIIGAGVLGREVLQYARDANGESHIAGFLDDRPEALEGFGIDIPIVGRVAELEPNPDDRFVVAVGDPALRRRLAKLATSRGARFHSVVHPSAWVAPSARLGAGSVVCPFAFVGVHARIGEHVLLNTYASVGHDAVVEDCTVLSPYAVVNGQVHLEAEVFMGTHATVLARQRVGTGAKIAAGSVVNRDVPARALAVGNPAKARVIYGQ